MSPGRCRNGGSHRPVAFEVDSRLDADDHVLGKDLVAALGDPGGFVVAQADPVARAVEPARSPSYPSALEKSRTAASIWRASDARPDHPEAIFRASSIARKARRISGVGFTVK